MRWNLVILWVVALGLWGCGGSRLTNENLSKVALGMEEEAVAEILGKPHKMDVAETLGIRSTAYYYRQGEQEVKIIFMNGEVFSKKGRF